VVGFDERLRGLGRCTGEDVGWGEVNEVAGLAFAGTSARCRSGLDALSVK